MLLWVTGVYGAVLAVLLGAVVVRKARRDRAEERSRRRRSQMLAALESPAAAAAMICDACVASTEAPIDLHWLLSTITPAQLDALRAAIAAEGTAAQIATVLEAKLRARRPADRALAALLLGELSLPGAPVALTRAARDRDADVRLAACRGLAHSDTDAAARALIELLEQHTLPAKRVVERLAAPWAVGEIIRALREPKSAEVRGELARSLGLAGDPVAIPVLAGLLPSLDAEDRINATRALGELDRRTVAPLVARMLADGNWRVRAQAARSLGCADPAEYAEPLGEAMGDPAWWVRTNAAEALAHAGPVGQRTLERVASSSDPYAAERARETLQRYFDPGPVAEQAPW